MTWIPTGPTGAKSSISDIDGQSGGKVTQTRQFVCNGTSQIVAPERPRRHYVIFNAPTELGLPLYLLLGEPAGTTNHTVKMYPGDTFILGYDSWNRCEWTGRVSAITDGLDVSLNVTEVWYA